MFPLQWVRTLRQVIQRLYSTLRRSVSVGLRRVPHLDMIGSLTQSNKTGNYPHWFIEGVWSSCEFALNELACQETAGYYSLCSVLSPVLDSTYSIRMSVPAEPKLNGISTNNYKVSADSDTGKTGLRFIRYRRNWVQSVVRLYFLCTFVFSVIQIWSDLLFYVCTTATKTQHNFGKSVNYFIKPIPFHCFLLSLLDHCSQEASWWAFPKRVNKTRTFFEKHKCPSHFFRNFPELGSCFYWMISTKCELLSLFWLDEYHTVHYYNNILDRSPRCALRSSSRSSSVPHANHPFPTVQLHAACCDAHTSQCRMPCVSLSRYEGCAFNSDPFFNAKPITFAVRIKGAPLVQPKQARKVVDPSRRVPIRAVPHMHRRCLHPLPFLFAALDTLQP